MMRFGTGMLGGGFSIIFWIIIIGVVYYIFKEYSKNNHRKYDDHRHSDPGYKGRDHFDNRKKTNHKIDEDSSEEIARQRYAKGEISKEELREILDNLNS